MLFKRYILILLLFIPLHLFASYGKPSCPSINAILKVGIVSPIVVTGDKFKLLSTPLNNYETEYPWRLVVGLFDKNLADATVIEITKADLSQIVFKDGPFPTGGGWHCWYMLPDDLYVGMFYELADNMEILFKQQTKNIFEQRGN